LRNVHRPIKYLAWCAARWIVGGHKYPTLHTHIV
jgi:hypothetical protein